MNDDMMMKIICAVTLTLMVFHVVKFAKARNWPWFYWFLFLSVSGSMLMGAEFAP